ncbi:hypothetical protein WDU94_004515 [Cyamophila willieti]
MKSEKSTTCHDQNSPSNPAGIPGIRFQRAKPEDICAVHKLLANSFFRDEPILKALGLVGKISEEFIAERASAVREDLTILAIDDASDDIIAAAINQTIQPEASLNGSAKKIDQIQCPHTKKLAKFWHDLSVQTNVFSLYNVPDYMEVSYLATSEAARGKGLAESLTRESIALAKELKKTLVCIYCTNFASARIAMKMNMKMIRVHCIHKFFHGEDLVAVSKLPHDKIYVFALELPVQDKN